VPFVAVRNSGSFVRACLVFSSAACSSGAAKIGNSKRAIRPASRFVLNISFSLEIADRFCRLMLNTCELPARWRPIPKLNSIQLNRKLRSGPKTSWEASGTDSRSGACALRTRFAAFLCCVESGHEERHTIVAFMTSSLGIIFR
jgi:hypothetical protein